MIKKKIKEVFGYIFADQENFSLEHRLFLSTLVIGIIISLIGAITNLVLAASTVAVIVPVLLSGFVLVLYYFVRFKRIVEPLIIPLVTISMFGISAIWIFNGGINGSNIMPAFVILILALIVVPVKAKKYVVTLFIALNIFILLIQLYRPDLIVNFPSETERWVDNLITLIYSAILIFFIINFVHKNYTIERLRAEESEKKLAQLNIDKDRYISILAHDLKSPFNNLLGISEVLRDDIHKLDIKVIEGLVKDINRSAQITYDLLEDILLWARTQQNKIPFNPQKLDLEVVCRNVLEVLNSLASAKNISTTFSAEKGLTVFADIDMLKTILRNLVSNAIKFSKTGGAINISAIQTSSDVTISVSDNGVGIKPEDLTKLFDISQVLSTKGTAGESGTGLGLFLCKDFVEKHGGKIFVESEIEKGTEFKITLPVVSGKTVVN
jgi:two-component system, sensor histidine kinase and response regulator